jgi:hypothetical protein
MYANDCAFSMEEIVNRIWLPHLLPWAIPYKAEPR